jgi:hypothetical protein
VGDLRVALDLLVLLVGGASGLVQDAVGDAELAESCRREARIRSLVASGGMPARSAIATATFATPSEWR